MSLIKSSMFQSSLNCFVSNNVLKVISSHLQGKQHFSIDTHNYSSYGIKDYVINRNPRNLERLRIARKPTGFHLEKPGKTFWHKVIIEKKSRFVIAKVYHNNGNSVIQASTNEWGINRHLYRTNDVSSYIVLAKVLADRCIESGIHFMLNSVNGNSVKKQEFIKHFEEGGITLLEPSVYSPLTPWNLKFEEKPWKIHMF